MRAQIIVSSKTPVILNRHNATGGFETSTPSTGSPEPVSSCRDSSSCQSSETNGTDVDLTDITTCTPFARRVVLDNAAQLLEHVLVALENVYDNSRNPSSSIPWVLDDILAKSDYATFMKIMSSLIENWAKYNRLIAKPALAVAEENFEKLSGIV